MDELIAIGDDSNKGSLDVNLNLMNITSDDDLKVLNHLVAVVLVEMLSPVQKVLLWLRRFRKIILKSMLMK